eukprot:11205660-Lingulodinium_polyedra.AAC.1
MMYHGHPKTEYDIGWILPIRRLQDERGPAVNTNRMENDRNADGQKLEMRRYQGLTFVDWNDFMPLR